MSLRDTLCEPSVFDGLAEPLWHVGLLGFAKLCEEAVLQDEACVGAESSKDCFSVKVDR